jgi:hypothetical protein
VYGNKRKGGIPRTGDDSVNVSIPHAIYWNAESVAFGTPKEHRRMAIEEHRTIEMLPMILIYDPPFPLLPL